MNRKIQLPQLGPKYTILPSITVMHDAISNTCKVGDCVAFSDKLSPNWMVIGKILGFGRDRHGDINACIETIHAPVMKKAYTTPFWSNSYSFVKVDEHQVFTHRLAN